jgi:hypothetical protein
MGNKMSSKLSFLDRFFRFVLFFFTQAHQRLKITKEHTIKPKEEAEQENHASASNSSPKNLYCSVHRQVNKECVWFICKDLWLWNFYPRLHAFLHFVFWDRRVHNATTATMSVPCKPPQRQHSYHTRYKILHIIFKKPPWQLQGMSYLCCPVHSSVLHGDWCTANCEAHTNFESICLWANNVQNEVVTIHTSQEVLKMLSLYM